MNIVAKTVNSTAIKVTWQAPLYPNGEIYYRLYYWQSIEGAGTKSLAYDGPSLGHTVTGLHEYVTYTFMLQAYNFKYLWTSKAINATVTTHPAGKTFVVYNTCFFSGHQCGNHFFDLNLNSCTPFKTHVQFKRSLCLGKHYEQCWLRLSVCIHAVYSA